MKRNLLLILFFCFGTLSQVYSQIALRGSATSGTSAGTTLTINKPSGVVAGDVMIVNICQANSNIDPASSGWTLITGANQGNYRYSAVMYKVATGVEGNSYVFTLGNGTDAAVGSIIAFSGVDGSSPFDVNPGNMDTGATSTATATGITTNSNNSAVIFLGGSYNTSWSSWSGTSPSFNEIMEFNNSNNLSVAAAWGTLSTAGSTGNKTVTLGTNAYYGVMLLALRASLSSPTTYTSSGTFTVPSGVTQLTVQCWGGGGGGSTVTSNNRRGGGGGGGAYATSLVNVTPGNIYSVVVGAGGSANSAGGNSSFGTSLVVAAGGSGGTNNSATAGSGGTTTASTGTIKYAGGNGANGGSQYSGGGGGGAGSTGAGGNAPTAASGSYGSGTSLYGGNGGASVSGSSNGNAGNTYGGGGSGSVTNSNTDRAGGSGAPGQVIISWVSCVTPTAFNVTGGGSFCSGGSGVSVGLSGSETGVTYQLFNGGNTVGSPIFGTGSSIDFGSQTSAGTYTVVATRTSGGCTANMSGSATVTVNSYPIAPTSASCDRNNLCSGDVGNISLSVSGGSGTTLKWFSGSCGGTIVGTGNPLTISAPAETTTYYARWETDCGNSACANVTVNVIPSGPVGVSITANPTGPVCVGTSVTYTANPSNGGSSPVYQWKVNGTNVGINSNQYTYSPADGDIVSCVVTSNSDCATGEATVPILYFSWNDTNKPVTDSDWGIDAISVNDGEYVSGGVGGTTCLAPMVQNSNVNLTFDGNAAEFNGGGIDYSISYRRSESVSQMFTRGSSLIITGGANFSVSYRVSDGAGGFSTISSGNVYAIPQDDSFHNYRFKYDPSDGYGRLYVDGTPIWESTTVTPGMPMYWTGAGDVIVGVETDASGTKTPTFDNLTMNSIELKTATALVNVVVNQNSTINLTSVIGTDNQTVCQNSAINNITYNITDATGATFNGLPIGVSGNWTGGVVTISGTPTESGIFDYTVIPTGACGTATARGTIRVNSLPTVSITGNNSPICYGSNAQFTISGTSGSTVSYSINGTSGNVVLTGGSATITVNGATSNQTLNLISVDNGNCARNITGSSQITVRPVFSAGTISTSGESICYGGDPGIIGSLTDATGGDGSITYKWQANGVDIASSSSATLNPPAGLTTTTTYTRWAKDNTCNTSFTQSTGSWVVTVTPSTSISSQSTAAQTTCLNDNFTSISLTASGTGTLTYQWYSNTTASTTGGTNLGNANGAQTNTFTPQASSPGTLYYYCVVTGTCGSATSAVSGAFVVNSPVSITQQPVSLSNICLNSTQSFSVVATGTSPLSYQWKKNGVDISGATSSTLTLNNIQTSDADSYSVVVSNTCGSVTSSIVSLALDNTPPVLNDLSSKSQNLGCVIKPVSGGYVINGLGLANTDFSDNCDSNTELIKQYKIVHNSTTLIDFGSDPDGDASGFAFPEGISTIIYRIKDQNNNTSSEKSFTVEFWYLPGVSGIKMN